MSCTSDDFIESSEIVTPGTDPGNGGSAPSDPTAMLSTLMSLDVLAFQLPRTYTNATLQVSSPEFASGGRISLGTSTAATGDTSFYGLILSPTLSGTQTVLKSDISTSTTTQGSMGGGGGGFGPGGGMGPH
ncbi:MAG: hypothetical protein IJ553_02980 [Alloprevotella sp.]|nr:hypothetical protein [Alloprevotella sp.]